jgi:hypothetical protein
VSYTRGPGVQHWHSIDTLRDSTVATSLASLGAIAWGVANRAVYIPVAVNSRVIVKKLWYANGPTATGNYDIGLYDAAGVALLRKGSTVKTTAVDEIVWDCTDTIIGPGIFYLALVSSNNTDTFDGFGNSAPQLTASGALTEASVFPLPATATFALTHSLVVWPSMGMFLDTKVS